MIDSGVKGYLNSVIFKNKNIISEISKYLGTQCCVVSLDLKN